MPRVRDDQVVLTKEAKHKTEPCWTSYGLSNIGTFV